MRRIKEEVWGMSKREEGGGRGMRREAQKEEEKGKTRGRAEEGGGGEGKRKRNMEKGKRGGERGRTKES